MDDGAARQPHADVLTGSWVLVVGPDAGAAARMRARLATAGAAAVELIEQVEDAIARASNARPDAVLVLAGRGDEVRARLDPLATGAGPPVVSVDDIPGLPGGELGEDAVLDRLTLLMERHRLRGRVRDLEEMLSSSALASHHEAQEAQLDALHRLAQAAEYRDDNTWEHTQRVAAMAARLGRRIGLEDSEVDLIRQAAPLHDLGKIAIPDTILLKPQRLTDDEFAVVKTHAAIGAEILGGSNSRLLETAAKIAGTHHERWDSKGYPDGLAGEEIPIVGRLVAVADVFDILVHERPYKEALSVDAAGAEIVRNAGTQFDPAVVEAFDDLGAATWLALASEI